MLPNRNLSDNDLDLIFWTIDEGKKIRNDSSEAVTEINAAAENIRKAVNDITVMQLIEQDTTASKEKLRTAIENYSDTLTKNNVSPKTDPIIDILRRTIPEVFIQPQQKNTQSSRKLPGKLFGKSTSDPSPSQTKQSPKSSLSDRSIFAKPYSQTKSDKTAKWEKTPESLNHQINMLEKMIQMTQDNMKKDPSTVTRQDKINLKKLGEQLDQARIDLSELTKKNRPGI